jgi:hypothetical protein
MGGKCSTNESNEKKYIILVGKPVEKKIIIKSDKRRQPDNIKTGVNISAGSRKVPMIECCQYSKKFRGTKNRTNFWLDKRLRASEETFPSIEFVITTFSFSDRLLRNSVCISRLSAEKRPDTHT